MRRATVCDQASRPSEPGWARICPDLLSARLRRPTAPGEFGLIYAAPFLSYTDRFLLFPLLVPISRGLGASLASVSISVTGYLFLYGAMQAFYGIVSDRVGRVRVMRAALVGVGVSGVVSAAAPSVAVLVASRAVSGAFAAALLPSTLVYIGDRVPFERRQRMIANVLAMGGLGTALAILGAGLVATFVSWRVAFVVPAVCAPVLAVLFRALPESLATGGQAGALSQVRGVLARGWVGFLLVFGLAEGSVILGFFTFLAPALEAQGHTAAIAGLVVAVYGVGTMGGVQVVKRLVGRISPTAMLGAGGSALLAGYLVAAHDQGVAAVFAASVLLGLAFSSFHSTMQTWATEVAPEARGTATSLFVTAVFTGAAATTAGLGGLADAHRFGLLFLIAAAVTVPVAVVGAMARSRFRPGAREGAP